MSVLYFDDECGREGGMVAEPEARCHVCKSRFFLRLLSDGRFECYDGEHIYDLLKWQKIQSP